MLRTMQENGKQYVIIPFEDYQKLVDKTALNFEEQLGMEAAKRSEESFPLALFNKIDTGENPIKIFREYRGYNATELAEKAKISNAYLSQIENGLRVGSSKTLVKIASILNVPLEEFIG